MPLRYGVRAVARISPFFAAMQRRGYGGPEILDSLGGGWKHDLERRVRDRRSVKRSGSADAVTAYYSLEHFRGVTKKASS